MKRISIELSKVELLFMKEAMEDKFDNLIEQVDDAEVDFEELSELPSTFTLNPQQVQAMKNAGVWDDPSKRMEAIKNYVHQQRQNVLEKNFESFKEKFEMNEKPKKPHWTHTAKGKKILAARKRAKK
jgi:hypothetical protein